MRWRLAFAAIGFAVGIAIGLAAPFILPKSVDTNWSPLVVSTRHFGVSYSTTALFSDIPPPEITAFAGRYKFLDPMSSPNQATKFGYVIDATMAQIDFSKVPPEYLQAKETEISGHKMTSMPIDSASYGVIFTFHLKDKDGFELMKLTSAQEYLVSGKANRYQNTVEEPVPYGIALRTKSVDVEPQIAECGTCRH